MKKSDLKIYPEDLIYCFSHLISCMIAAGYLLVGPEMALKGKTSFLYKLWPHLWVMAPIVVLTSNAVFFFIEKSILGILSVGLCVLWMIYAKMTLTSVLHLMGIS